MLCTALLAPKLKVCVYVEFISQTGIENIRGAAAELDEKKGRKGKQREKMAPKLGRIDIDYQVLHDAFFRYQTKPKLSIVGDLCVGVAVL